MGDTPKVKASIGPTFVLGVWSADAVLPEGVATVPWGAMAARQKQLLAVLASDHQDMGKDKDEHMALAEAILADRSAGIATLCDPSLIQTLSLWRVACDAAGIAAKALVLLEGPSAHVVARQHADPLALESAVALEWLSATLAAERASRGMPRRLVALTEVDPPSAKPYTNSGPAAVSKALYAALSAPNVSRTALLDALDAARAALEAEYTARRGAEEALCESRVAATRSRDLAEAMATQAVAAAEAPLKGMVALLVRRVLGHLAYRSRLTPRRMADRFARSAAKRDPSQLLEMARSLPSLATTGPADVTARRDHFRDPEYRPHAPPVAFVPDIRAIAFYLPQFHPFPENDAWWGKGFTEWTNVGKALPLFEGHHQPHCPIHLGYYDLRVPQIMEEQAQLARAYGVGGFAYYFYWFAGRSLMEMPLRAMLGNPRVDMPFCLTWANENWTRRWDGRDNDLLIGQRHSLEDSRALIRYLEPYFRDPRHIRVDGKPVFLIYRPGLIPDMAATAQMWRDEANAMGLGGLHLVAVQSFGLSDPRPLGLDAAVEFPPHGSDTVNYAPGLRLNNSSFEGFIHDYQQAAEAAMARPESEYDQYRGVMLSWDNTARKPDQARIYANFSVATYRAWLTELCRRLRARTDLPSDRRMIFINAWNEWAEGTHLEPDQRYGYAYLAATADALRDPDGGGNTT